MNKLAAITVFLLACTTQCVRAGILAGPITNSASGHIYYLLTQNNWVSSEQEAKNMGGHLATIDDAAEQQWVYATFTAWGGSDRSLLIGLNDRKVDGSFRWSSGAPVTYSNWHLGEPNGGTNENVVQIYGPIHGAPGKWNDISEFTDSLPPLPFHGVVEIDPVQMQIHVSQVAISWNSTLDINYQVQYVTSLNTNSWSNLGMPVMGTGSNNVVFDSVLDRPRRFYRVISVP